MTRLLHLRLPMTAAVVLGFSGLLAPGCKDKKPTADTSSEVADFDAGNGEAVSRSPQASIAQVIIEDVSVDATGHQIDTPLDTEMLALALGRQLTESGLFFALPNDADPLRPARRAQIALDVSTQRLPKGSDSQPSIMAAVEVRATWVGESKAFIQENLVGELGMTKLPEADLPRVVTAHVAQTVREAGIGLIRLEGLRGGPIEQLQEALKESDDQPNLLRFALMQVPARKPPDAVALVAPHLKSKHPEVRRHAMAALVALKDPEAVQVLADSADFSDYDAMRAVIEAVSAIGGDGAREYLEFVASGHPDDGIKSLARKALDRL